MHYDVPGDDFTRAGEASSSVKKALKQVGLAPDIIRNVAIAMYEGEINMVIHAGGGQIDVDIAPDAVRMVLKDQGPGIPGHFDLAMQAGWSTAPDECTHPGLWCRNGPAQYEEIYRRDEDREPP